MCMLSAPLPRRTERFQTDAFGDEARDVGGLHAVPSAEALQVIPPQIILLHPDRGEAMVTACANALARTFLPLV